MFSLGLFYSDTGFESSSNSAVSPLGTISVLYRVHIPQCLPASAGLVSIQPLPPRNAVLAVCLVCKPRLAGWNSSSPLVLAESVGG
jgi:hypothetical protein